MYIFFFKLVAKIKHISIERTDAICLAPRLGRGDSQETSGSFDF